MANYDFSSTTVFSGARLTRLSNATAIDNSAIEVIYIHDKIVEGHNGMFDQRFLDFRSKYIAYIEGK